MAEDTKPPVKRRPLDCLVLLGCKKPPVEFTEERQETYLVKLAECGIKTHAAAEAGVTITAVRDRRLSDKKFAEQEQAAQDIFGGRLLDAARQKAEGWLEPVYQKGRQVFNDCEDCGGFGYLSKQDRAIGEVMSKEDPKSKQAARDEGFPLCLACGGTGQGKPAMVLRYSERLTERLLGVYDSRFKDKAEPSITINGGVLAVPIAPTSAEDWHRMFRRQQDDGAIDVTEESRDKLAPPGGNDDGKEPEL